MAPPEDATAIRRKPKPSVPAAEPMAHANAGTKTRPDFSENQVRLEGAQASRLPVPDLPNKRENGPQPQTRPKRSSLMRRASERDASDSNGPSTAGAPTLPVRRDLDRQELTHSLIHAANVRQTDVTAPGFDGIPLMPGIEPTPGGESAALISQTAASPDLKRTLRGVDRSAEPGNAAIPMPRAERTRLGGAKTIVHRISSPDVQRNIQAGIAMNGIVSGVQRTTGSTGTDREKLNVASNGRRNNSRDERVQRVVAPAPGPAAVLSMSPLADSITGSAKSTPAVAGSRKFTGEEIDYLSSKVYIYIKRRLMLDRERSGNPGFALWR